jgi:hypothetical protein
MSDDEAVGSDPEAHAGALRARKRVRAPPSYTSRRVLLVGRAVGFKHDAQLARDALRSYIGETTGPMMLGIVELQWELSRTEGCSRDASIVHDIAIAMLAGRYQGTNSRFLDYVVTQAGWVPMAPYVAGGIAQVILQRGLIVTWSILYNLYLRYPVWDSW